ncbi:MAG: hypothetical protein WCC17_08180 [Candidatus Nitrosopolaris sp.]
MSNSKTTGTVRKTRKKNIGSFLAMLFCTLVIVSSIGSSFAIRNSYAQAQQLQLEPRQAPTIPYQSPWSNNLQVSSASSNQPLCKAGICSQSLNPATNTHTTNVDPTTQLSSAPASATQANNVAPQNAVSSTTQTTTADPTKITLSNTQTSTNDKTLSLRHSFVSNKVVGPDRFRFIGYYWTSSNTNRGVDVGTSANSTYLTAQAQPPNVKQQVDTNEGQNSIAIQLQYQGVVKLEGVTAALKLPTGFKASIPLIDDPNRWDIALSQYRGNIIPGQGITLYFTVVILRPWASSIAFP